MVGSAKSEQQKLPLPFVLGSTESTLNSSINNTQAHQPPQLKDLETNASPFTASEILPDTTSK